MRIRTIKEFNATNMIEYAEFLKCKNAYLGALMHKKPITEDGNEFLVESVDIKEGENCCISVELIKVKQLKDSCDNKIHNLEINKYATLFDMMVKFGEEIKEVYEAVNNLDEENFIEELLDVVQVCYGLAYTQNINLDDYINQHNDKLLSRGHKFID